MFCFFFYPLSFVIFIFSCFFAFFFCVLCPFFCAFLFLFIFSYYFCIFCSSYSPFYYFSNTTVQSHFFPFFSIFPLKLLLFIPLIPLLLSSTLSNLSFSFFSLQIFPDPRYRNCRVRHIVFGSFLSCGSSRTFGKIRHWRCPLW